MKAQQAHCVESAVCVKLQSIFQSINDKSDNALVYVSFQTQLFGVVVLTLGFQVLVYDALSLLFSESSPDIFCHNESLMLERRL